MPSIVKGKAEGRIVGWTNTTGGALANGAVVTIGPLVGILLTEPEDELPDGTPGNVSLEGVVRMPKQSGSIARGAEVDYDASADSVTSGLTPDSGDVTGFGVAVESADASDPEVVVRLTPGRGVLN